MRDGAEICDTCGATMPPPPPPSAPGETDPWAGSEPFMAGLPDPWADAPVGGAPATPRGIADRFDPSAPPPPPASPMRAPKQGALPHMPHAASGVPPKPAPFAPPPAPMRAAGSPRAGGGLPADADLPSWLFEPPSDWQAPGGGPDGAAGAWPPPPPAAFARGQGLSAGQGMAQGSAWPEPPASADEWDSPATAWGRSPATPRAPGAWRGQPTPQGMPGPAGIGGFAGQGWGAAPDIPPPPPPPSWNRPPAPPSEPLGSAWPSVAPLGPAARPRKRGWSLPLLPFGRGKAAGKGMRNAAASGKAPRRPVFSRRLANGGEAPTGGPGWHIVASLNEASAAPASFLAPSAAPRGPNRSIALITGLSRLTFNLVLLGIIIAILAIPISIGLTRLAAQHTQVAATAPAGTPHPIPTPYPGSKAYQSAAYVLDYPAGWKQGSYTATLQDAGQVSCVTFQASGNVVFAIATFPAQPSSALPDILGVGLIQVTPGSQHYVNQLETPQPDQTLDGIRWLTERYTFNLVTGAQTVYMEAAALVVSRGDNSYLIVYQAPAAQFDADYGSYFQPVLKSFRFRS